MREMIFCKVTAKDRHSFFLKKEDETIFLFSQTYRHGVANYYRKGVSLKEAMDHSRSHHDRALARTMTKIPMYIKYVEKEYGIEVFEQTKKKRKGYKSFGQLQLSCA